MTTLDRAMRTTAIERQPLNWELGLLVLLVALLIIAPLMRVQTGSGPLYLTDMVSGLLLVAFVLLAVAPALHLSAPAGLRFTVRAVDGWALLFLALIMPSALVNLPVFGVLPVAFVYLRILLAIVAYFIVRQYVTTPALIDTLLTAFGLTGVVAALIGLAQLYVTPVWRALEPVIYFGTPITAHTYAWNEGIQFGLRRAYGGYSVPTAYAGMLMLILFVIIYLARRKHAAWWLGAAVVALAIFETWSRHIYPVILVAVLATWLFVNAADARRRWLAAALFLLCLGFVALTMGQIDISDAEVQTHTDPGERLASLLTPWNDSSFRARVDRYGVLLEYVLSDAQIALFGSGHSYLQFSYRYTDIQREEALDAVFAGFASNSWLLVMYNYGIPAFIALMVFWGALLALYWRRLPQLDAAQRAQSFTLCLVISAVFFAALADNYIHMQMPLLALMWVFCALFVSAIEPGPAPDRTANTLLPVYPAFAPDTPPPAAPAAMTRPSRPAPAPGAADDLIDLVAGRQPIGLFYVAYAGYASLPYAGGLEKATLVVLLGHSSRMVFGWGLGAQPDTWTALAAWVRAQTTFRQLAVPPWGLIVHQNRAPVFTAWQWQWHLAQQAGVRLSYTPRGAGQIAALDDFFAAFKATYQGAFLAADNILQLAAVVERCLIHYHHEQPHPACDGLPPAAYVRRLRQASAVLVIS